MTEPKDPKDKESPILLKDRKVIDFFSGKAITDLVQERIIRITPEYDGLSMLYSNENNPDKYFSMKILFWGLRWNGDVVGLVPWLNQLVPCSEIQDPLNGCWEGYYDPDIDSIFYDAPMHKVVELETSLAYFETHLEDDSLDGDEVLQELPDTIGTHAMLLAKDQKKLSLTEVVSWRLYADGSISGMLMDPEKITQTPVLAGDPCLYRAEENPEFRYFFQHHIANQIKSEDPEALQAIALLLADQEKQHGNDDS
jgi:hypothetical protein